MTADDAPDPPKPPPIEVVIVAAAVPIPVVAAAQLPIAAVEPVPVVVTDGGRPSDLRPDTFTGRPDPLGPNPTVEQLQKERDALRRANDGRFSVEDAITARPTPPRLAREPIFTVIAMLVALNTAKLCLIVWVLLTVLQVQAEFAEAAVQRQAIAAALASLHAQLDRAVSQQQALIDRVDGALVRLGQPPPAR